MYNYEILKETAEIKKGRIAYRIKALNDIPHLGVKKGDIGGWVEHHGNLLENAWIFDDSIAIEEATVSGNSCLRGHSTARGNATIYDNASVRGGVTVCDHALVYGDSIVESSSVIADNASVSNNAFVSDSIMLGHCSAYDSAVVEHSVLHDNVTVYGHARIENSIIKGSSNINGNAHIENLIEESEDEQAMRGTNLFDAYISENANITSTRHVLHITHFGSEHQPVTLYKTLEGANIQVGCWTGKLENLLEKVNNRKETIWYDLSETQIEILEEEYKILNSLCEARVRSWEKW